MIAAKEYVVVTGASGFIGKYLVESLAQHGYQPVLAGRQQQTNTKWPSYSTDYSVESLNKILKGASTVVHLAGRRMNREDDWLDLEPFYHPNVRCIRNLTLSALEVGVKKIILASTRAVYSSDCKSPYQEIATAVPASAYGLSKLMAEQYLALMTRNKTTTGISLRFGAVFGYGERNTPALMKFVEQAQHGECLTITGNQNYRIDQIYVEDAVAAVVAAIKRGTRSGTYNIGSGRGVTVLELATKVNEVFGQQNNLRNIANKKSEDDGGEMSIERARVDLGWIPRYSLIQGLVEFRNRLLHNQEPANEPE